MPETTNLPLSGRRTVEFSHRVMGPACGVVPANLDSCRDAAR